MKLLIISAAFPPMHIGEAMSAYYLAKRLAGRGLEVHVLTSQGNSGVGDQEIQIHAIMRNWSWTEVPKLTAFLKANAPDAIVLEYIGLMYGFHPMVTFVPTICKRLFRGVPFVSRFESAFVGADPSETSWLSRAFRKFIVVPWAGSEGVVYGSGTLLRDSDYVIAMCERHRRMLMEEWPPVKDKVALVPPPQYMRMSSNKDGEARQKGRTLLGVGHRDFVMAFFGYLYPLKGIEYLLQSFEKVRRQRPGVKLVFVGGQTELVAGESGDSYANRMRRLATELGLEQDVKWTGAFRADDEEPSWYLHAADIGVLPFLEGVQLNNSSFSVMAAHGLPIVSTRGPVLDAQFVHGENILLTAPRDVDALERYLVQLVDNAELRARLRAGVEKLAQDWFSWEATINRMLVMVGKGPTEIPSSTIRVPSL